MNKVALIGRLTKDVELKTTQSNNQVANFTLAVNRRFTKEGEERQADFINIIAWGKTAEFCNKYFSKGLQIGVTGRIQTRTWDDDQGKKHYATEVVAEEVDFADGKKEKKEEPVSDMQFENTVTDFEQVAKEELPF